MTVINPQLEDGYTRIANSIIDCLAFCGIPQEPMRCMLVVIRKTYGYQRKEMPIQLSEFVERTGMRKPNVSRALKWLIDKNMIIRRDNGTSPIYKFNKNFQQWESLSRQIMPVISSDNDVISSDNDVISSDNPTFIKENNKENNKEKTRHGFKLSDEITKSIYSLYNETINPIRKSAVRAKTNIAHHLKHYRPEDLKQAISNYNTIKPDGPEYRKDPANFFGKTEPYFVDYLPENFDAPKEDDDARFANLR